MKNISCFLLDYEPYGLFIGCQLLLENENLYKIVKTRKFYNTVNVELEKFFHIYSYSKENLEKWFERPIGIFKQLNRRGRPNLLSEPPSSYENVAWFLDSRSSVRSRCSKCPNSEVKCKNCQKLFDGEVCLITEFTAEQVYKTLFSLKSIPVKDLTQALKLKNIDAIYEVFTAKRRQYLQKKYRCHIYLYERKNNEILVINRPYKIKYDIKLDLLLTEPFPETINGVIENFLIVNHASLLPQIFLCEKTKGCSYTTPVKQNFEKHQKVCGIFNVKQIICHQKSYGDDKSTLKELVVLKLIPREALSYRNFLLATFDIETIEEKIQGCQPIRGMNTEANLKLLSIAVGSNIPETNSKCWVRNSMNPMEEKRLIVKFVAELDKLQRLKTQTLPDWVNIAYVKIEDKIDELKAQNAKYNVLQKWYHYRSEITKFMVLDVFGFNCGRFDIPCIAAPLFLELKRRYGKVTILKKTTSYISVSTNVLRLKTLIDLPRPVRTINLLAFGRLLLSNQYGHIVFMVM